jgi:hypothetical protein
VHLFRPRLSFLAEAQPRLDNRRGQKALFGRVAQIFFLGTALLHICNIITYLHNLW